jgi:hypothetical protein
MDQYEALKRLILEWTRVKRSSTDKLIFIDEKLDSIIYDIVKTESTTVEGIAKSIDPKNHKTYINKLNGVIRRLIGRGLIKIKQKMPMRENNKTIYRIVYEVKI